MAARHSTPIQFLPPLEDGSIQIPLTQGFVAIIDPLDEDLAHHHWFAASNGQDRVYAQRRVKGQTLRLYRIIMERMLERSLDATELVDHIDNNSLNNRRTNLRLATRDQNMANSKRNARNQSGYKGVYRHSSGNKWVAQIQIGTTPTYLGLFDTAELASAAYNKTLKDAYGEYARLE